MFQIRSGVFETNSSSTHSICIPKKSKFTVNQIHFKIGEYGWENASVDPASYLYTAILCYGYDKYQEKLNKLTEILNRNDIVYTFEKPEWDEWYHNKYLDNGGIDHSNETRELVEMLLENEDMLLRYLSAGKVYTGNDNQEPDYSGCNIADEYMYDYNYNTGEEISKPNPYHDEDNYDYFYKGN